MSGIPSQFPGPGPYGQGEANPPGISQPYGATMPPSYGAPGAYPGYPQAAHPHPQQPEQAYESYQQPFVNPSNSPYGGPPQSYNAQAGPQDQGFMPNFSPLAFVGVPGLISGGQNWGQQYVQRVQQRMGWLSTGVLNYYFSVNKSYILSKLFMLACPYLKRWTYSRQAEQVQGAHKYRPPKADVNSPDLYIPMMAMWTYAIIICLIDVLHKKFTPELIYATVWSASMAWFVHLIVAYALLRAMQLPTSISWVELGAYTGYSFAPVCVNIVMGVLLGSWGYWTCWFYGSLCSAIFLVRTMKRIIFQEARGYTVNFSVTNYLLLGLALFQFPFAMYLGHVPLPSVSVAAVPPIQQPLAS